MATKRTTIDKILDIFVEQPLNGFTVVDIDKVLKKKRVKTTKSYIRVALGRLEDGGLVLGNYDEPAPWKYYMNMWDEPVVRLINYIEEKK